MASLLESLAETLGGDTVSQLAGVIGGDNDGTGKAIAAALPALLGGLANNVGNEGGASALFEALGQHDGSILDNLGGLLGGGGDDAVAEDGNKILGHVLGDRRDNVSDQISKSSGLNVGAIAKLLPILAPIVLGYLSRRKNQDNLDSSGLADVLRGERDEIRSQDKGLGGIMGMLDKDGDGSVMDDLGDLLGGGGGKGLLGKLMGK